MKQVPKIKCPTCKKHGAWLSGPYAPFCSRRCQLVDLGKWFNEDHCISEPLRPDHVQENDNRPQDHRQDDPDRETQ